MTAKKIESIKDLRNEAENILTILKERFPGDAWIQGHIIKEMAHIRFMEDRICSDQKE